MLGRTHITTGVTAAAWTAVPLAAIGVPMGLCLLSIPVGAYAALFPDIDHPHSRITWCLPPVSNAASWVLRGCPFGWTIPPLTVPLVGWMLWRGSERHWRLMPWEVNHRYEMHTKTAAVIFGLALGFPWWFIPAIGGWWWVFALQITVGCLTHRWGDMRTTGGLPVNGEWKTIGWPFDVASEREYRLRAAVYRPVAIVSTIVSVLLIARVGTP